MNRALQAKVQMCEELGETQGANPNRPRLSQERFDALDIATGGAAYAAYVRGFTRKRAEFRNDVTFNLPRELRRDAMALAS